jgi:hypothetical protein
MRKKKILILVDSLGIGGTQEQILNLVKFLKEYDFTILSCFSDDFYSEKIILEGGNVIFISSTKGSLLKKIISIPGVFLKFNRFKKNILNYSWVNIRLPYSLLLSSIFKLYKFNHVCYSVECTFGQLNLYEKIIFNFFLKKYKNVCIAQPVRQSFKHLNIPKSSILDDMAFTTHRIESKNPIIYDNNKYNLLFVARLIPLKGLKDSISIVKHYNNIFDDKIDLHVIGDGPDLIAEQKICNEKNLTFVHFYGFQKNIEDYYVNASGLIKTSHFEPANSVVREFLAIGKLVFSTLESLTDKELENEELIISIKREDLDYSSDKIKKAFLNFNFENQVKIKHRFNNKFGNEYVKTIYVNLIERHEPKNIF